MSHSHSEKKELTVRGDVDLVRQLGHVDLEAVLHVVQSLGVGLVRHKGYSQPLCAKPTGTGNLAGAKKTKHIKKTKQPKALNNDQLIKQTS